MKKIVIYYFLFILSTLMFFSSGVIDSQDGFQYLAVARNIYYKGEPTAPEYEYDTRKNIHMSTIVGKNGKSYSPTGLGFSLAYLPAVAITDVVYKFYGVPPPVHFPLENDWLIFLTASFTNSFFGAFLGVVLFLYLLELGLSKKQAVLISLVGIFSTNLLVYTKHSFPHMMFTCFLLLSFYFVKRNFSTNNNRFLILSGLAFGITSVTYNQIFLLAVIPMGVYLMSLSKSKLNFTSISRFFSGLRVKYLISKFLILFIGFLPFVLIYFWFENLRTGSTQNLANPVTLAIRGAQPVLNIPKPVFFEGIYGQLFSPGRSLFLYSPILLFILVFWHKVRRSILPELLLFISISVLFIFYFGAQRSFDVDMDGVEKGIAGLWHGESSWGPRYLTPLIPLGLLVVGFIFTKVKKIAKMLVFVPLVVIGLYVNFLGVILPYQIKYHDLELSFYVNNTEFTNFAYSNFLPRYSPIIQMSKSLVKLGQNFPKTFDHGAYNVQFYDGIDFPFQVGGERWRVIEGQGHILFDDLKRDPVKKISIGLINHPIEEASYSAVVEASVNDKLVKRINLLPTERSLMHINIPQNLIMPNHNQLQLNVKFKPLDDNSKVSAQSEYRDNPATYENKNTQPAKYIPQIMGLVSFSINDNSVNRESIDFPYVSSLGEAVAKANYQQYGENDKDPWKYWSIHTQMYERLPDIWWVRNLYYWDIPKMLIISILFVIIMLTIICGVKTYKSLGKIR